ncbi:17-beta-hydroxysteroid dehydrogenase type 2, partial [Brachyistius frenatus]|uniref:17-beta-hydroxysteroid dehydrogenase type 2 n=1 Tax=Brachyistius frenatus TaxID=100188 RepID=UPI0037E9AF27
MEDWTGVCGAAVFVLTVGWTLRRVRVGALVGALVTVLVGALVGGVGACWDFTECRHYCSAVLFGCSFTLICVTLRRETLLQVEDKAVLVTGCDSGFGHALAALLSDDGVKVFAGVLDVNGGGARRLRERRSKNLQVLQLDVTDGSQVEAAHLHIRSQVADTGLWGLVNNAGVLPCPVDAELLPLSACRRCVDVNFLAAVHMCQVFLPLLRRSRGRIVNMSSMGGDVPMPMFGAYGASKAALSVFSRVMRLELAEWGVDVALIQPSGFRTNIFGNKEDVARHRDELLAAVSSEAREDYGEAYISSLPGSLSKMSQQSAEDLSPVVEDMRHALLSARPRPLYTPGAMGWLLPFLHRCCPTVVFDAVIKRLVKYTD